MTKLHYTKVVILWKFRKLDKMHTPHAQTNSYSLLCMTQEMIHKTSHSRRLIHKTSQTITDG